MRSFAQQTLADQLAADGAVTTDEALEFTANEQVLMAEIRKLEAGEGA